MYAPNLVHIRPGDKWKTAFLAWYGHFECLVMLFILTNAPNTFQHFMKDVFMDILDQYVIIYLYNTLVFSEDLEQYYHHVWSILGRL